MYKLKPISPSEIISGIPYITARVNNYNSLKVENVVIFKGPIRKFKQDRKNTFSSVLVGSYIAIYFSPNVCPDFYRNIKQHCFLGDKGVINKHNYRLTFKFDGNIKRVLEETPVSDFINLCLKHRQKTKNLK